jgi:hypothetical protein
MGEIINVSFTGTTTIKEDNQRAIAYCRNALVNEKTKYIGLKWHFLHDHMECGTNILRYLPQTKWWQTYSPNHNHDAHSHDIEVHSWGEHNPMQRFIP